MGVVSILDPVGLVDTENTKPPLFVQPLLDPWLFSASETAANSAKEMTEPVLMNEARFTHRNTYITQTDGNGEIHQKPWAMKHMIFFAHFGLLGWL